MTIRPQLLSSFQTNQLKPILGLAFSPSGRNLVTTAKEGEVCVWSTGRWAEESSFRAEHLTIEKVVYINDWTFYAFGLGTVLRYQTFDPKIENVFQQTPGGRFQSISPDENWIASATLLDGAFGMPVLEEAFLILDKWKTRGEAIQFQAQDLGRHVFHLHPYALSFSPDSHYLAICIELNETDWEYRLYMLTLGEELSQDRSLPSQYEGSCKIEPLCFSPDSRFLAYGYCEDNSVHVIKTYPSFQYNNEFYGHDASITALAFHPNSYCLASGSKDKALRIWDLKQDSLIAVFQHSAEITALAFHPKENILTIGDEEGRVSVVDVPVT